MEDVRTEIRPYVAATQPPNQFGIPEPPRLNMKDIEGLLSACPLLKACFSECLRLYSRPIAVREVKKGFSVTGDSSKESGKLPGQSFAMRLGTYLVAPLSLYNQDNGCFDTLEPFGPRRLLSLDQDGHQKCDISVLKPWALDETACPGKGLAERQVLVFVAAILSLWDIDPAGLKGWSIPQHAVFSVVAAPRRDFRVLIRARVLSYG